MNLEKKHPHLFIIGNPLSGSSMLYRLLSYHRDMAWFSQWTLRNGTVGLGRKKYPFARILDKQGRRFKHPWSKVTYMRGLKWFTYRIIPSPADGGDIWDWVFPGLRQDNPYERDLRIASGDLPVNNHGEIKDIKKRLDHVIHEALRITGNASFIGKRPILAYTMPIIKELLPRARFVHIVRDPRAFVLSWINKHWDQYQQAVAKAPKQVLGGLETAVLMMTKYWLNTVNFLADKEKQYGEHVIMTIRYEDLIADVHTNILDILSFAGLPKEGINLAPFPKTITNTNDRYINKGNQKFLEIIQEAADGVMQQYDYGR